MAIKIKKPSDSDAAKQEPQTKLVASSAAADKSSKPSLIKAAPGLVQNKSASEEEGAELPELVGVSDETDQHLQGGLADQPESKNLGADEKEQMHSEAGFSAAVTRLLYKIDVIRLEQPKLFLGVIGASATFILVLVITIVILRVPAFDTGYDLYIEGEYAKSIQQFSKHRIDNPLDEENLLYLGLAYNKLEQQDKALEVLLSIKDSASFADDVELWYALAFSAYRKSPRDALGYLSRVIVVDPDDLVAQALLVLYYFEQNDVQQAYQVASRLRPKLLLKISENAIELTDEQLDYITKTYKMLEELNLFSSIDWRISSQGTSLPVNFKGFQVQLESDMFDMEVRIRPPFVQKLSNVNDLVDLLSIFISSSQVVLGDVRAPFASSVYHTAWAKEYVAAVSNLVSTKISKQSIVNLRNLYAKYSDVSANASNLANAIMADVIFNRSPQQLARKLDYSEEELQTLREAIELYREAQALSEKNYFSFQNMVLAQLLVDKLDVVEEGAENGYARLSDQGNFIRARYLSALLAFAQDDYLLAVTDILSFTEEQQETYYSSQIILDEIYLQRGQVEESVDLLTRLVTTKDSQVEAYIRLMQRYLETGRQKSALNVLARAQRLFPGNTDLLFNAGLIYFASDNVKLGKELLLQFPTQSHASYKYIWLENLSRVASNGISVLKGLQNVLAVTAPWLHVNVFESFFSNSSTNDLNIEDLTIFEQIVADILAQNDNNFRAQYLRIKVQANRAIWLAQNDQLSEAEDILAKRVFVNYGLALTDQIELAKQLSQVFPAQVIEYIDELSVQKNISSLEIDLLRAKIARQLRKKRENVQDNGSEQDILTFELAAESMASENYEEALSIFKKMLEERGDQLSERTAALAHYNSGVLEAVLSQYTESVNSFKTALSYESDVLKDRFFPTLEGYFASLSKLKKYNAMIALAEEWVDSEQLSTDQNHSVKLYLGFAHANLQNSEAVFILRDLIAENDKIKAAYYYLSNYYHVIGQNRDATAVLYDLLEIDPEDLESHLRLVKLFTVMGESNRAAQHQELLSSLSSLN